MPKVKIWNDEVELTAAESDIIIQIYDTIDSFQEEIDEIKAILEMLTKIDKFLEEQERNILRQKEKIEDYKIDEQQNQLIINQLTEAKKLVDSLKKNISQLEMILEYLNKLPGIDTQNAAYYIQIFVNSLKIILTKSQEIIVKTAAIAF